MCFFKGEDIAIDLGTASVLGWGGGRPAARA